MPVEALSFNIGLTDNLSMETFYQWNWKETRLDPVGTFFSETDLFADGGNTGYSDFTGTALDTPVPGFGNVIGLYQALGNNPLLSGALKNTGLYANGVTPAYGNVMKVSSIGKDINARNDGQFGVAFRYIAEELNSTEFGFCFVNYHSKEPTLYADIGDYAGPTWRRWPHPAADRRQPRRSPGQRPGDRRRDGQHQCPPRVRRRHPHVRLQLQHHDGRRLGVRRAGLSAEPADRHRRHQRPDRRPRPRCGGSRQRRQINVGGQMVGLGGQIHNYERVEAFNTSLGTIYNFGPSLSFDSLTGVAELASEHLRGSSLKYTAYDGSTRYYAGRGNSSYVSGGDRGDQVNRNAYGYTLLLSGTWNDVFAGVNVSPYVVYKDDFEGNSYQTGNFIEGRKAYPWGSRPPT